MHPAFSELWTNPYEKDAVRARYPYPVETLVGCQSIPGCSWLDNTWYLSSAAADNIVRDVPRHAQRADSVPRYNPPREAFPLQTIHPR